LRNLELGIICRRALAAKDSAAAIFLIAIFMMRHAAGCAENLWRGSLVERHAAIWADWLGH
jgi:hypothetical protein